MVSIYPAGTNDLCPGPFRMDLANIIRQFGNAHKVDLRVRVPRRGFHYAVKHRASQLVIRFPPSIAIERDLLVHHCMSYICVDALPSLTPYNQLGVNAALLAAVSNTI